MPDAPLLEVNRCVLDDTKDKWKYFKRTVPWHMKYIIVPFNLKNAFKDHELQKSVIEEYNLDWTIVRPGNMTNSKITKHTNTGSNIQKKLNQECPEQM